MSIASVRFVFTYPAVIDRVIDGDTIVCHIQITPSEERHDVNVRVEGINAPERSQAGGPEATAYASTLLPIGSPVTLVASREDKYSRFLARIMLPDGRDFSSEMLLAGHAIPYAG